MPSGDVRNSQLADLTSSGVVVLDTTIVPDVVGLHAYDDKAALVRVLPGNFPNIVRTLVPDDRAAPAVSKTFS